MNGRDHGGGLDAAAARWGGTRADWLDLSTGINPIPYPVPSLSPDAWNALPDKGAEERLITAARQFWNVPSEAAILAAPGASALIARMPHIAPGAAYVEAPTYNEHAAAFAALGRLATSPQAATHIHVHPNNPDGRRFTAPLSARFTVIDESFCDVTPLETRIHEAARLGVVVLKSFGKFWGLAGLRLGFAIARPETLGQMPDLIGPWAVSGPALEIGAAALSDEAWAETTRTRLAQDTARLDALMAPHGTLVGGTTLFRLYDVADATAFQERLAKHRIWSRIFPYSRTWIRLGLPHPTRWAQLEAAL